MAPHLAKVGGEALAEELLQAVLCVADRVVVTNRHPQVLPRNVHLWQWTCNDIRQGRRGGGKEKEEGEEEEDSVCGRVCARV